MHPSNQGFLQLIIILILSVVILSFLGVSISNFVTNPILKSNFSFLWRGIQYVWNNYISSWFKIAREFIIKNFRNTFGEWILNVEHKLKPVTGD